jgi:hypothetical protein
VPSSEKSASNQLVELEFPSPAKRIRRRIATRPALCQVVN